MKQKIIYRNTFVAFLLIMVILGGSACSPRWSEEANKGFNLVKNKGGLTLG